MTGSLQAPIARLGSWFEWLPSLVGCPVPYFGQRYTWRTRETAQAGRVVRGPDRKGGKELWRVAHLLFLHQSG